MLPQKYKMPFVRPQEEELLVVTHVPFAASHQVQAQNYGSTQNKLIQTPQRLQDPQRWLKQEARFSPKRTLDSTAQGFAGILQARALLGRSLVFTQRRSADS